MTFAIFVVGFLNSGQMKRSSSRAASAAAQAKMACAVVPDRPATKRAAPNRVRPAVGSTVFVYDQVWAKKVFCKGKVTEHQAWGMFKVVFDDGDEFNIATQISLRMYWTLDPKEKVPEAYLKRLADAQGRAAAKLKRAAPASTTRSNKARKKKLKSTAGKAAPLPKEVRSVPPRRKSRKQKHPQHEYYNRLWRSVVCMHCMRNCACERISMGQ